MSDFIIFATADWHEPYWTNKQHTAKSFKGLGHRVLYIESVGLRSPNFASKKDVFRIINRIKKGFKTIIFGAKQQENDIWVLSPLLIPAAHRYPTVKKFNAWILKKLIERHVKFAKFRDPIIWTYHPFIMDSIVGLDYHRLVYHCVDDLSSVPGIDKANFLTEEQKLLRLADKVYTTTESLKIRCIEFQNNTEYFSNVVDFEHFSLAFETMEIPEDIKRIPTPRIIYHGVLSDFKVDFQLLYDVASVNKDLSFILLGDEREGQKNEVFENLKKLPNVYALGYRSYSDLPKYLSQMNAAILPTLINEYTNYMFPMKYYEYISAGIPIITTALKFTESVSNGLFIAHDVDEFSKCIHLSLRRGRFSFAEAKAYVGDNTWEARSELMLDRIDKGASD
ncbi:MULTISPECIES: glycosyltransferase [Rahnella]|uniref:Glycosyltransferase n=1 Tax=Rahnella laticis TaxID=2787622 RepID=A0ABS0E5G7_9GAMM|nr:MULTISPECIES: glycosyltransferase [Rahnella]MBF7980262.1 glycosyltransferase [Rahnella laticis]MBF8000479.1 glycosyltransferase [Rahnella sp. LAC-M12]